MYYMGIFKTHFHTCATLKFLNYLIYKNKKPKLNQEVRGTNNSFFVEMIFMSFMHALRSLIDLEENS